MKRNERKGKEREWPAWSGQGRERGEGEREDVERIVGYMVDTSFSLPPLPHPSRLPSRPDTRNSFTPRNPSLAALSATLFQRQIHNFHLLPRLLVLCPLVQDLRQIRFSLPAAALARSARRVWRLPKGRWPRSGGVRAR